MSEKKAANGTNTNKDVVYIDVEDEITGVIDKVRGSDQKIVALVLPKRATMLQSIVNIKLLKRAADQAKKKVVLITAESGLLPLAGSVGMYVAKSLNTKPEVPDAPNHAEDTTESVEEVQDDGDDSLDKTKTVGELSGGPVADDLDDTIELGDEDDAASDTADKKAPRAKNKKFKIPNFNKFRLLLVLGVVGVIALGSVGYAATVVMPRAKITIKTDSSAINSSAVLTLKTGSDVQLDAEKAVLPAQSQEVKKTLTQQVPATGQLNNGEKATGSVKLSLTDCSKDQVTVPAGTGLSSGGKTFITKDSATLQSVKVGSKCKNEDFPNFSTKAVDVAAQTGGSSYNIAAASFTVAGYANVSGQSSAAMSGGTDNIVKVVTQTDIDNAKQKIGQQDSAPIQQELKTALIGRDLFAIDVTFSVGNPDTKVSATVNTPADDVTVTQTIAYTMLGIKQDDLQKIIDLDVGKKIDTQKQAIVDYGIDKATFGLEGTSPDGASLTLQATVIAGAELHADAIKKQVAGKKAGQAKEIIKANPGVTDVVVDYSPLWVSSIPKNVNKITVTIQEPQVAKDAKPSP